MEGIAMKVHNAIRNQRVTSSSPITTLETSAQITSTYPALITVFADNVRPTAALTADDVTVGVL